jgi:hypothetical protein
MKFARETPAHGGHASARLLSLVAGMLIVGCEAEPPVPKEPPLPSLVPVRGRVTVDGKPLAKAVIVFSPSYSDAGTHSVGETKADGSYELSYLNMPGTGAGDYRVMISLLVGPSGKAVNLQTRSDEVVADEMNRAKEVIPPRYSDHSKTELRATVKRDSPPIDFDLQGPIPGLPQISAAPAPAIPPKGPAKE